MTNLVQFLRPGGMIRFKNLDLQRALGNFFVENRLRVERSVIAAHSGVIAADDEMRCSPCSGEKRRANTASRGPAYSMSKP